MQDYFFSRHVRPLHKCIQRRLRYRMDYQPHFHPSLAWLHMQHSVHQRLPNLDVQRCPAMTISTQCFMVQFCPSSVCDGSVKCFMPSALEALLETFTILVWIDGHNNCTGFHHRWDILSGFQGFNRYFHRSISRCHVMYVNVFMYAFSCIHRPQN